MPLPIQAGDSANKARAFFDLRGRIPLIFDETIVPVAVVGDLNIPGIVLPRQGEYQAFELNQAAGAAGEFSHIIFGPTPGSRETFVVRYFTVGSTSNTLTRVRLGKTTVDLVLATLGFDLNSGQTGMALEAIIQPDGTLPGGRIVSGSGVVAGTFANPFRLPLKIEGTERHGEFYDLPFAIFDGEVLLVSAEVPAVNLALTVVGQFYRFTGLGPGGAGGGAT